MALKSFFDQMVLRSRALTFAFVTAIYLSACASTSQPLPEPPVVEVPEPIIVEPTEPATPTEEPTEPDPVEPEEPKIIRNGLTLPHMTGRDIKRLAILLPFSSQSERLRAEAASMFKAAEMAVFAREDADVLLIALDTAGSAQGATVATRAAIKSGADVILGPVLSRSVKAASAEARESQTPIIAFSSDQSAAGNGTYLLSFPPEAEVAKIVQYAISSGAQRFAFLGPDSRYGNLVNTAYRNSVQALGGVITANESYAGNDISVMQEPAKKIADYYIRHEERTQGQGRRAFEAIILPEGGTSLRSLAPLLPYFDIDPSDVQFLGTGLWHNEDVVREPALDGGIFAGPPEDSRNLFITAYDQKFGEEPSQLASLAYDAVGVGAVIATGDPDGRRARAEDPAGFYGADGLIRFNPDGTPDRGFAVYQIQGGKFVVIEPAPRSATGPS